MAAVKGDDVVEEMEVYLTQDLADQLHVLQYPLRPRGRPYDMSALTEVRHRPEHKQLQVDLAMDKDSEHYDPSTRHAMERSTMSSTLVPAQTTHCIGLVADGKLHLTPLHGVLQMRPTFAHLDDEHERSKQDKEKDAKATAGGRARQESAQGGLGLGPGAADDDADDEKPAGAAEEEQPMELHVQFRRPESERAMERKKTSYATLHNDRESEQWRVLAHHPFGSDESEAAAAKLVCSSKAHVPFNMSVEEYGQRLACGRPARDVLSIAIDLEQVRARARARSGRAGGRARIAQPSSPRPPRAAPRAAPQDQAVGGDDRGLSKEGLRQMRPGERVAAILKHTHLMSFRRLCELCGTAPKQVLDDAADAGVLVQGCWVAKSALVCATEKEARCRDRLLLHFTRERTITTKQFAEISRLSTQAAREMLQCIATARPGHGWEFKLPSDADFEREHAAVAQAQRAEWARLERELAEQGAVSAAGGSAPPAAKPEPAAAAPRRGRGAAGAKGAAAAASGSAAAKQAGSKGAGGGGSAD